MMAQIGHADIKTTHTYYVAGLADAQLRAVDAIEEAFLAPLLGNGSAAQGQPLSPTQEGGKVKRRRKGHGSPKVARDGRAELPDEATQST